MSTQATVQQMLEQLELWDGKWQELDSIDNKCILMIENLDVLATLPKRVVGNLSKLSSKTRLKRVKTILSLARRMAREVEGAIVRRRFQKRLNNKTISCYSYRFITGKSQM